MNTLKDKEDTVEVVSEEKMKAANSGMGLPPGLAGLF